jgi:hypothetical protein
VLLHRATTFVGKDHAEVGMRRPPGEVSGQRGSHNTGQGKAAVRRLGLERREPDATAPHARELLVDPNRGSEEVDAVDREPK